MSDTNRYEILDSLPSYGPMYIPVSEYNKVYHSGGFVVDLEERVVKGGSYRDYEFQPLIPTSYSDLLYPNSAPPLTAKVVPVINLALSESRNTQASAMASPSGQYPNG